MALQPVLSEISPSVGDIKMSAYYSEQIYDEKNADGTHIHSCFEIYANVSGDVSFLHDREIYDIQPFDIVLSHPSDVHYCIYHSKCVHGHFCVWFAGEAISEFLVRRGIKGRIRPSADNREKIMNILNLLCSDDTDRFIRMAKLVELITLLDEKEGKAVPERSSNKMRPILKYIDDHLVELSGIGDVAKEFFIAESTVYKMFHTQLGISFNKYIETRRLALAERLLRADLSVTDACFLSGFTDCSRFIAKFKEKFGTTPLKYKKMIFENKQ